MAANAQQMEYLRSLYDDVEQLPQYDINAADVVKRRAEMLMRNIFGPDSKYIRDLKALRFSPQVYPTTDEMRISAWTTGRNGLRNITSTMLEELELFGATAPEAIQPPQGDVDEHAVFVVHGHDEAMKESVARTLETLDLAPVILHEKPNAGRTIIEKFTDYAAVGFAVVLLSPDDIGAAADDDPPTLRPRARQNVIFELGFFIGRLGRERVVALYREADDFEFPSDYSGVIFVPFDPAGRWKFDLAKELKAAGYSIDANKLLGT